MPIVINRIAAEEPTDAAVNARKQVEEEYDAHLAPFTSGDRAEVVIDDESKVTVRNRLRRAAERRGLVFRALRTRDPQRVRFELLTPQNDVPSAEDVAEPAGALAAA